MGILMDYDVIIIGGSYAGLPAGLQLARARRKVLVIDAGQRRNRSAAHSHGFLTQEGQPPAHTAAEGRSEERRVGKECVGTCSSRGSRDHKKKKTRKSLF